MSPPCYAFPASELPERIQFDVHGRQRKPGTAATALAAAAAPSGPDPEKAAADKAGGGPDGAAGGRHRGIDLARDCTLLAPIVQYRCIVPDPKKKDSPVECWPVYRLFRRCQDRQGSFTVETTAWERTEG